MADFRMAAAQTLAFSSTVNGAAANLNISYRIAGAEGASEAQLAALPASISAEGVLTPSTAGLAIVEAVYQDQVIRRFAVQILSSAEVTAIENNNLSIELAGSGATVPLFVDDVTVE